MTICLWEWAIDTFILESYWSDEFPKHFKEITFKHDFIHICWWQFSSWMYKQATVEGNNDDHPGGGKMRQSNWPTCPEANHRIVQKWMLMWLVSKTRCILVYNPGNPDQEMFDVIQRCVNYILPPVTPSLIQSWTLTIAGNRLKANKQTTRHATYPASSHAQDFFFRRELWRPLLVGKPQEMIESFFQSNCLRWLHTTHTLMFKKTLIMI